MGLSKSRGSMSCQEQIFSISLSRQSLLIAAAKARVWASEGWHVVVTDGEARTLHLADFEKLFELKQVSTLTLGATKPQ